MDKTKVFLSGQLIPKTLVLLSRVGLTLLLFFAPFNTMLLSSIVCESIQVGSKWLCSKLKKVTNVILDYSTSAFTYKKNNWLTSCL